MIKVEKGIKIPAISRNSGASVSTSKYPFKSMYVNDSFFLQASSKRVGWSSVKGTTQKMSAVYAAAKTYSKYNGNVLFKITCRTVPRGIRVWRTR